MAGVAKAGTSHGSSHPGLRVLVLGGANTDIVGIPDGPLIDRDSNPGHVRVGAGGVARNVAENLVRLGTDCALVTAFGGDHNARELALSCDLVGIDVRASVTVDDLPGPTYVAILDENADMALALNDMRAIERISPEFLRQEDRRAMIDSADLLVADANLPAETLRWLAENAEAPLIVDPVSAAKAGRVRPLLSGLAAVTPNAMEAGVLLGRDVRNRDQAQVAARELVARGVRAAFVTCGAFGAAWADPTGGGLIPPPRVTDVVNATGAGDAFTAGAAFSVLSGSMSAREAAEFGSALAAMALESELTVSELITPESALVRAAEERERWRL